MRETDAPARRPLAIPIEGGALPGLLAAPEGAHGLVLFAHGSGSSRLSPRNLEVAHVLDRAGLATFLFDLLTPEEALDRRNVFDVERLAERLRAATRRVEAEPDLRGLALGYFGASTGAAAALRAAASEPDVAAIVSRGGRPDLASDCLADVRAATLFIVGGRDEVVLELNEAALEKLACEAELEVVEGATHLFEEPGALAEVAKLARDWFVRHLAGTRDVGPSG